MAQIVKILVVQIRETTSGEGMAQTVKMLVVQIRETTGGEGMADSADERSVDS